MKTNIMIAVLGLAVLTACGASQEPVKADTPDYPEGFTVISEDASNISGFSQELKHLETGCHFVAYNDSIEQMFVKENGVSVPYCD